MFSGTRELLKVVVLTSAEQNRAPRLVRVPRQKCTSDPRASSLMNVIALLVLFREWGQLDKYARSVATEAEF